MDRLIRVVNVQPGGADYELECGSQRFCLMLGKGFAKQGDEILLRQPEQPKAPEPLPEPKTKKTFAEKLGLR